MKIKLILSIAIISGYSLCSAMNKETPDKMLFRALRIGDMGLKLAEKAIALGANVNGKYENEFGLDWIATLEYLVKKSTVHETEKMVRLLLESGANINSNDPEGTALDYAKEALSSIQDSIDNIIMGKSTYSCLEDQQKLKASIINIINLLENWPTILKELKEREEKIKQEVNAYLLPELGNIVAQYDIPLKSNFKSDSQVSWMSV